MSESCGVLKEKLALVAGEGTLPVILARRLAEAGSPPLVLTLRKDTEALAPFASDVVSFRFPNLTRAVRELKARGVTSLILAGRVEKRTIYFLPALFDPITRSVLASADRDDHSLLGAFVEAFEREGVTVVPYWQILPEFLAREGRMSSRSPSGSEREDVACGKKVLEVTLPCSFGQAVVVAEGAVVAVEAMEGTDAMIERAGKLSGRGVVVKMMRRDQDLRYDLPTVGPDTIRLMAAAGLSCLALEADRTLVLEPDVTLSLADQKGIAVWGIRP